MFLRESRFLKYILRRILQAVPLVLVIITTNFMLIHLAPGDPVDILAGELNANPEYAQQLRAEFGLDQPLIIQLGRYITKLLKFDLGYSLRYRQDVLALILSRLPPTLLLMGTSLVISSFLGVFLGTLAAYRPYSLIDNAATLLALAGYSMPVFWLGQILLIGFALELGWFPMQGMISLRVPTEGWSRALDIIRHLALPALTFTVYHLTLIFRLTRVKMQEVLAMDFITTARAKGLPERTVVLGHALRNAMLPVVTVVGLHFGFMLAGSVLVETVFAWPGMGRLMFEAIMSRDYPVLMGLFFCVSIMVILANVLTDTVYAIVDPRVVYR